MNNKTAQTYNGHKNWQFWNVSLWLNNDESMYYPFSEAAEQVAYMRITRRQALDLLMDSLPKITPDGAEITREIVRHYLNDEIDEHIKHS